MKTTKLLWLSLSLMILMACNKDNKNDYPKQITFSDYYIGICHWSDLTSDSLYIMHSEEDLLPYLECNGYPYKRIDFTNHSLLILKCDSMNDIVSITKSWWQTADNQYELNVHFLLKSYPFNQSKIICMLVPKMSKDASVKLNIKKTNMENLSTEMPVSLLHTSWKLKGVYDAKTKSMYELAPNDCEYCYTLVFNTDTFAAGFSVGNELWIFYEADSSNSTIQVKRILTYLMPEKWHGEFYYERLEKAHTFVATDQSLKLYYNENDDYLLYEPWTNKYDGTWSPWHKDEWNILLEIK